MKRFAMTLAAMVFGLTPIMATASVGGFPSKPIRIIVPFAPGGTQDILGRMIAPPLANKLGVPVLVENRPGAQALIGLRAIIDAEPDGHVIGFGSPQSHAQLPALLRNKPPFDPVKHFSPIITLAAQQIVMSVHPSVPARNLKEFIEWASVPEGRVIGTTSAGSTAHLTAETLNQAAGTRLRHVPYRTRGNLVTDVVGGHIPVIAEPAPSAAPLIRSGALRPIAVSSPKRSPLFPDVISFKEAGFEDTVFDSWLALFGPAGMPEAVVHRLYEAIAEVVRTEDIQKQLRDQGFVSLVLDPDRTRALVIEDSRRYGELLERLGIRQDEAN